MKRFIGLFLFTILLTVLFVPGKVMAIEYEEFDDEDDAIEYVEDYIKDMIADGNRDEIEWVECTVTKKINDGYEEEVWSANPDDYEEEEEEELPEEPVAPEEPETNGAIGTVNNQFPTDFGDFPTDFGNFKKF